MENKELSEIRKKIDQIEHVQFKDWVSGKSRYIPGIYYLSIDTVLYYVRKKYLSDKSKFLLSGSWPDPGFINKNKFWAYYYFLQIQDNDLNLDKYLDFSYDTTYWTKSKLLNAINKYGYEILYIIYRNSKEENFKLLEQYKRLHL